LVQVKAASVIPISSDSSEDSVGSHVPRVIFFGTIPAIIPVIPVVPAKVPIVPVDPLVSPDVGAVSVTSLVGVLDLVDYSSSSDSDPSEDSLPLAPELPLVSPFLCFDDSEVDSKVASRPTSLSGSSYHDILAPSSEFPLAPIVSPSGIRRRPAILIRLGEAILFGRPYRTRPNGPHKLMNARKRVGPFPARRLAWRRVSHHSSDRHSLPDFTLVLSSSGSSLDSSLDTSSGSPSDSLSDTSSVHSLGFDASGQSHLGPSTRVASSRLVYPPVMTLRYSEAFRRWRYAPLSYPYPLTTLESSLDSSSERSLDSYLPFTGLSRKRCRSPTTLVPSSTPILRSIAPTYADLLPPLKRFRDSYSPKDSREDHMEIDTADAEAIADLGISDGVGAHTEDVIEAGQLMASGERAGLTDRIRRLGRENLRVRALLCIERYRVDSLRHHMALSQEEFHQIRKDHNDARRRLRRLESFVKSRLLRGVWDSALSLVGP
ncbi:hypothetical protein Tco_0826510, partial [Tanacetum coccineum]